MVNIFQLIFRKNYLIMKNNPLFLLKKEHFLHILHLSAIAGCAVNLFVKLSFTNIFTALAVSTIYVFFISRSRKLANPSLNGTAEIETTEVSEMQNSAEPDAIQHVTSVVKGNVTIIPVLTEQLKAVISQTDSAAENLIAAFLGINRQSKKQLQSVKELFGDLTEQSGENTLTQTQQELEELEGNFSVMNKFFDKAIGMISDVMDQLSKVDQFALRIKKIGQMTNILAINAAIEAAHTGETGSGFKVIASEINTLSKDSNDSIKEITELTEKLTANVDLVKQELESVNKDTTNICCRTQNLFTMAMGKIGETLQNATSKIRTIAGDAEDLNKEISNIVVSIQFQDITRQRIEHVISPLESLQNEITDMLKKIDAEEKLLLHSVDNELMKQYTMESERELLRNIQSKQS